MAFLEPNKNIFSPLLLFVLNNQFFFDFFSPFFSPLFLIYFLFSPATKMVGRKPTAAKSHMCMVDYLCRQKILQLKIDTLFKVRDACIDLYGKATGY
jgi:hypothetical protein